MKRLPVFVLAVLLLVPLAACDRDQQLVLNCYRTLVSAEAVYLAVGSVAGDMSHDEALTPEQRKALRDRVEPMLEDAYQAIFFGYDNLKEYILLTNPTAIDEAELLGLVSDAAASANLLAEEVIRLNPTWEGPKVFTFRALQRRAGK